MFRTGRSKQPELDLSPEVSDAVRKTTCYMCACRCGIDVHLKADEKQNEITADG